jgi:hypothetical protein
MKKWNSEEIDLIIKHLKNNKSYEEISILLNRSFSSVRNKIIRKKLFIYKDKLQNIIYCLECGKIINTNNKNRKFCNNSCSAIFNNKNKNKKQIFCINCNNELTNRQNKYCSSKCHSDYKYNLVIEKWINGDFDGLSGEYGTSKYIKKFLIKKHGEKCMECEWDERNLFTGNIPIELEHIDGNYTNNKEENLKLLCPNCHSLTKTYKGANKGKGRNRKKYYINAKFA